MVSERTVCPLSRYVQGLSNVDLPSSFRPLLLTEVLEFYLVIISSGYYLHVGESKKSGWQILLRNGSDSDDKIKGQMPKFKWGFCTCPSPGGNGPVPLHMYCKVRCSHSNFVPDDLLQAVQMQAPVLSIRTELSFDYVLLV